MAILRPFIIDEMYQDATKSVQICMSHYLRLFPVVSGYLYLPQLSEGGLLREIITNLHVS